MITDPILAALMVIVSASAFSAEFSGMDEVGHREEHWWLRSLRQSGKFLLTNILKSI
jgi:hypothetical protein